MLRGNDGGTVSGNCYLCYYVLPWPIEGKCVDFEINIGKNEEGHRWLDTAVVLDCRSFMLRRRKHLYTAADEVAKEIEGRNEME